MLECYCNYAKSSEFWPQILKVVFNVRCRVDYFNFYLRNVSNLKYSRYIFAFLTKTVSYSFFFVGLVHGEQSLWSSEGFPPAVPGPAGQVLHQVRSSLLKGKCHAMESVVKAYIINRCRFFMYAS